MLVNQAQEVPGHFPEILVPDRLSAGKSVVLHALEEPALSGFPEPIGSGVPRAADEKRLPLDAAFFECLQNPVKSPEPDIARLRLNIDPFEIRLRRGGTDGTEIGPYLRAVLKEEGAYIDAFRRRGPGTLLHGSGFSGKTVLKIVHVLTGTCYEKIV